MPTLSTLDIEILDEAVETAAQALRGITDLDDLDMAISLLQQVRRLVAKCENPDGKFPLELVPGDRIELGEGQWVDVIGMSWQTDMGVPRDGTIAVPHDDGIAFLPRDLRVKVA